MRWIANLLLLFVMLASPLAMHPAASAPVSPAAVAMVGPGMQDHCPPRDRDGKKRGLAGCAMACASALPAAALPAFQVETLHLPTPYIPTVSALSGLAPEAAIPPPRAV